MAELFFGRNVRTYEHDLLFGYTSKDYNQVIYLLQ